MSKFAQFFDMKRIGNRVMPGWGMQIGPARCVVRTSCIMHLASRILFRISTFRKELKAGHKWTNGHNPYSLFIASRIFRATNSWRLGSVIFLPSRSVT